MRAACSQLRPRAPHRRFPIAPIALLRYLYPLSLLLSRQQLKSGSSRFNPPPPRQASHLCSTLPTTAT